MNEIIQNMTERRSCRVYKEEQIKEEELTDILTAGKWAPSGKGAQSPMFVVVQDNELIKKLAKMNALVMGKDIDPFYGAPTLIIVFADSTRNTYVEDGSLAMGNMMNAAHSLGIGSCWIHRAKEVFETEEGRELMKEWKVPNTYVGIANCILGYPNYELPEGKPRKDNYVIYVRN